MAILYPRNLRSFIRRDAKLKAEVQVYDKLADVLDDKYYVFHSVRWTNIDDQGRETDGECDFLVAHPIHGILVIEVKGGAQISNDKKTDVWLSKDHNGKTHSIKNPVKQAISAKHQIKKLLDKSPDWPKRHIQISHGVIFPGVATPKESLGLEVPLEVICCADQFRTRLRKWLSDRLRQGKRDSTVKPLGDDGIASLRRIIGDSITLNSNVRVAIEEAKIEYKGLEPSQYEILNNISRVPRALIEGGAGTGKTVLAIEEAKRLADAGFTTLYSCYNKPLALDVKRGVQKKDNLTIANFHSVCATIARETRYKLPPHKDEDDLYDNILPEALFEIMTDNPERRYDAIIIDEGQDFQNHWWTAVQASLKVDGKLRVFADNNQNVYGVDRNLIKDIQAVPVDLTLNFRNTKCIHKVASVHYKGIETRANGPDGIEVSWIVANNATSKIDSCVKQLVRLLENDKVVQGDIAVLFNKSRSKEEFLRQIKERSINIRVTDAEELAGKAVVVDTVRRFKGLERMAIVLVVDGIESPHRELAYVAFSRARAYLCVIGSKKDHKWLKGDISG